MAKETKTKLYKNFGKKTFAKPKVKSKSYQTHDRRSTSTPEEIEAIRKQFNIVPKDPNDRHGFPHAYQKGM